MKIHKQLLSNGFLSILLVAVISSCAPEIENNTVAPIANTSPTTYNPSPENVIPTKEQEKVVQETPKRTIKKSQYFEVKTLSDTGELKQTQFTLRENIIDSLNKIVPVFDTGKYNLKSISYFTSLSEKLHGKTFFADNSDELVTDVMEILTTRLEEGTDIVFLIDKTGSMDDDIDKVQESMKVILSYLKKFNNVRLGIAAYGDKNWHYDLWYNYVDLSNNAEEVEDFLSSFNTLGNPDVAESVNDAIVETLDNMSWQKGNNRLMLLIGDAPSQLPPNSSYSTDQVVKKCDSMNVKLNLYPIVLAVSEEGKTDLAVKKDFAKVFPVPANNILNLRVKKQAQYWYTIIDMSGKQVLNGSFNQKDYVVDLSSLSNGNYLIQIQNLDASEFYTQIVPIAH